MLDSARQKCSRKLVLSANATQDVIQTLSMSEPFANATSLSAHVISDACVSTHALDVTVNGPL